MEGERLLIEKHPWQILTGVGALTAAVGLLGGVGEAGRQSSASAVIVLPPNQRCIFTMEFNGTCNSK